MTDFLFFWDYTIKVHKIHSGVTDYVILITHTWPLNFGFIIKLNIDYVIFIKASWVKNFWNFFWCTKIFDSLGHRFYGLAIYRRNEIRSISHQFRILSLKYYTFPIVLTCMMLLDLKKETLTNSNINTEGLIRSEEVKQIYFRRDVNNFLLSSFLCYLISDLGDKTRFTFLHPMLKKF